MNERARDFEALENEAGAFQIEVDGVPVWERIRFDVFQSIQRQNGVGQAHTQIGRDVGSHFRALAKLIGNCVHRNPFLSDPAELMFVGHQRRKKQEDGYWWDIYCDPIHESCDFDAVHFEYPFLLDHKQPAKTDRLRYLDLIQFGGTLQQMLGLHKVSIPRPEAEHLREIKGEITNRFGATVDLEDSVVKSLRQRRSVLWLYEELLDIISPDALVLVVSYGKEPLIEACKRANVPVVELQHGAIHRDHFAYHYPGDRTKEMAPDYLLTWGEFWSDSAAFPIEDEKVIAVGYPYLEMERQKYTDVKSNEQILFISQGTVGHNLSRFAVEFNNKQDSYDVVYKLHPGEYDRWREEYPWLSDSELIVVDDDSIPLYQLFAESEVQVGVGSTAIFEGLSFELETYLIELPGINGMRRLIEQGYVEVVDSPDELKQMLLSDEGPVGYPNDLFSTSPIQNTCDVINNIMCRGSK